MRRHSPYNYAFNNPVNFVDPDGRQPYNPRNFYGEHSVFSGNFDPNSTLLYGTGSFGYTNFAALSFASGEVGGGGSSTQALIAKMFDLGGIWTNTGNGFESGDKISLGYNGSYQSLNTGYAEGGIGDKINNIPEVIIPAIGNASSWNSTANYGQNSFSMFSIFTGALGRYNLAQSRSLLYDSVENTKVGQSVSAAENFLFLELPASFAGGELLSAGWRAAGVSKYLGRAFNYVTKGGPTFSEYKQCIGLKI